MENNLWGSWQQWLHAPLWLTTLIGKPEDKQKYFNNLLVYHIPFFLDYHCPTAAEIYEAWGTVYKKPKRISQCCLINSFGHTHILHPNRAQSRLMRTYKFSQQPRMLSMVILLPASPRATEIWIFWYIRNMKTKKKNERFNLVL